MERQEMTPEQQLAFDGFIVVMAQRYMGCLLERKDFGNSSRHYERENQNEATMA